MLKDTYKQKGQRKKLVEVLIQKGISDPAVLSAIETLPRHYFTGRDFQEFAYEDKALPIAENQTISQPYTVAYQSQLLEASKGMKVLEIGTGSGYQSAVLAMMGCEVHTIERKKSLHNNARNLLLSLGFTNIHFYYGDGSLGLPEKAPFDRIIVTAGAPDIPPALLEQLAPGGKLVIPVGGSEEQKMVRVNRKPDGSLVKEEFHTFRFVPLLGENAW